MIGNNRERMAYISALAKTRAPSRFQPGDRVLWHGLDGTMEGVVDHAFFDLQAAIDGFAIPPNWYETQNRRPKTPKTGRWFSVILDRGAVLAGEADLEPMTS